MSVKILGLMELHGWNIDFESTQVEGNSQTVCTMLIKLRRTYRIPVGKSLITSGFKDALNIEEKEGGKPQKQVVFEPVTNFGRELIAILINGDVFYIDRLEFEAKISKALSLSGMSVVQEEE